MKVYVVGGWVRDSLMGRHAEDKDYVVVGSTPEEMLSLGYKQVGADFPVFLHPETGDEYALARKERKEGKGYTGFVTDHASTVTLDEDLGRRDLTMNAVAMEDEGDGSYLVYDPYGGQEDMHRKVLRHVPGDAFAEDPVRVLRLARFRARFGPEWTVAPETQALVQRMAEDGVLAELNKERVWKELSRAMMEPHPRLFFDTLKETGALAVVFPEVHKLTTALEHPKWHPEGNAYEHTMLVLTQAVKNATDFDDALLLRLAALMHDLGKGLTDPTEYPRHYGHDLSGAKLVHKVCDAYAVPAQMKKVLSSVTKFHMNMHRLDVLKPKTFVKMFDAFGAVHSMQGVKLLHALGVADARGRLGSEDAEVVDLDVLLDAALAYRSVKFKDVVGDRQMSPNGVHNAMSQARVKAVKERLKK